jgi:predicted Ser/Thr protein kinase
MIEILTERGYKLLNLIKSDYKYKDYVFMKSFKQFKSKKNTVALISQKNRYYILKWFLPRPTNNMSREYYILKSASSEINVPKIYTIDQENNIIIMSYIKGKNLNDVLNDKIIRYNEKEKIMKLLSTWFLNFHNFFNKKNKSMIRADTNLRNFILSDKIWGIDFEESRIGRPGEDIADMISSILSTNPMFTNEKFNLCQNFLDYYLECSLIKIKNIHNLISYYLSEKSKRRYENKTLLKENCEKIKKYGLISIR